MANTEQSAPADSDVLGRMAAFFGTDASKAGPAEASAPQVSASTEQTSTEAPAPQAEEPAAEEAPQEGEQAEEAASPELAEVEINGKTYHLPQEVKNAVMARADYDRRSQAVAEEKRHVALMAQKQQLEAAVFSAVKGKLAELEAVKAQIEPYAKADLRSLDAEQRRAVIDELTILERREKALQGEVDQISGQVKQQVDALRSKAVTSAYEVLAKHVPGFAPGSAIEAEAAKYALSVGVPTEQFVEATLFNPGFAVMAAQAAKYAQLQAGKTAALGKVAKAPPIGKPGTTTGPDTKQRQYIETRNRLRKSGRVEDAASLILQRMK